MERFVVEITTVLVIALIFTSLISVGWLWQKWEDSWPEHKWLWALLTIPALLSALICIIILKIVDIFHD